MGGQEKELDMRRLIAQVAARPVIWDKSLEEYKCRAAASAAWRHIGAAINPDFNSLNSKKQKTYVKLIMKKWVNVKDSWLRYNKKLCEQRSSIVGGKLVKKYIFHDQLEFLKKNYINNEMLKQVIHSDVGHMQVEFKNESNSTTETGEIISEADVEQVFQENMALSNRIDHNFDTYNLPPYCKKLEENISLSNRVDNSLDTYDTQPYNKKLKTSDSWLSTTMVDSAEDRHMSFFRGILPSLKTLSENDVLEFQVGVMQTLKGIKDAQKGLNGDRPL